MNTNYEKLKKVLAEIFQLDQADLDFGIYRIMNQKRDEITRFLEKDLLPQVKDAFAQYRPADKAEIQRELDDAVRQAKNLSADPDDLPKVKELKARYSVSVDLTALEEEVFSHLANFFRRYYDKGDFISQRRYKEGPMPSLMKVKR
jgi:adenine-specific DNA-methyltransferase